MNIARQEAVYLGFTIKSIQDRSLTVAARFGLDGLIGQGAYVPGFLPQGR